MKKLLLAIVILLITNAVHAQPGQSLPAGNLLAWYPFCADTTDHGGTGYHLNNQNVALTTDRFGQPNRAFNYNGSNSKMFYTTTFPLSTVGGNITYSVWMYPTALQNSIVLYNGNPNLDGLGIVMNDGTFGGGAGNQVGVLFGATNQVLSTSITLNQWHHLVVTRTGNGFYFYVDTAQIGYYVPFTPPGFNPTTSVFQLGIDYSTGSKPFTGKIDDVAIYDRFVGSIDVNKLYHYTPDIFVNLGPDVVTCNDTVHLYPDTITYRNSLYYGTPAWYDYKWYTTPLDYHSERVVIFATGIAAPPQTLVLEVNRLYSCLTRDTVVVTHVVPHLNLGNDTIFCKGSDPLVLDAGPATGSTFLWSTGATSDTIAVTVSGIYSVRKDSASCIAVDTIKVTVADSIHLTLTSSFLAPPPSTAPATPFVVAPNKMSACMGGSYVLDHVETYGSPVYIWQDGITTTPTLNVTASGKYWVQVTDSGCVASDTVRIAIVYDTVTIFTPDTAICKGATFVAAASSAPGIIYQWTPTTGIPVSTTSTPSITPDTSAWYVVTAIIVDTIADCHIRDSFYVDVQPYPIVNMGGNRNICKYDTIHIAPVISPGWYTNYIYDWTPGTFLDDSVAPNVVYTAGDTTKLVLVVTTPAGCRGADSIIIYKYNGNFASMSTDTTICPGDTVLLAPSSSEPGTTYFQWHPSTFIDDSNSATPTIVPITSLNYVGIATSQYGCQDTVTYSITVKPAAVITLPDSVVLFPGETYQMSPITNCTNFNWFPGVGLSDTSLINPVASPPTSAKYILYGITEWGCSTTDSINIRLSENTILTVPNAFTPNGDYNVTIKAIIKGIARLRYFRIYNRYGNLVYNGKDINEGWDGTINGVTQPMGVYVYEAEAITDKGRIIQKQGNITLLR